MPTNPPSDHDGLRHEEVTRGGGGSDKGETTSRADLDAIRQRAASVAIHGQAIIAMPCRTTPCDSSESVRTTRRPVTPRTIRPDPSQNFRLHEHATQAIPGCCAGFETEYAVAPFDGDGRIPPPGQRSAHPAGAHTEPAKQPGSGGNLTNGGKLYRERGAEGGNGGTGGSRVGDSECSSPVDLVVQCEARVTCCSSGSVDNCASSDPAHTLGDGIPSRHRSHQSNTSWATHFNVMTTSSIERLVSNSFP